MKKYIILGAILLNAVMLYANITINDMKPELIAIGITEEKVAKASDVLEEALKKNRVFLIELDQKKLEINKLLIEDAEKNWFKINQLFDEIGQLNANVDKNRLKTQIEVRKYISTEDYQKAIKLYRENSEKKE